MNYLELTQLFNKRKDFNNQTLVFDNDEISIQWFDFTSEPQSLNPKNGKAVYDQNIAAILGDNEIIENAHFQYPVFMPKKMAKNTNPLILLHGLNERSWDKYLPWAYQLSLQTNRGVILFPIAYHINRGSKDWSNRRSMQDLAISRKEDGVENANSSFANASLSNRLSDYPLRFFTSGRRSVNDLILLTTQFYNGHHPLFAKGLSPDFFAYSIGAFLAQILFLANPNALFNSAKLFIFCGGAFFSQMNGLSKMIMDERAFKRIYDYYLNEFALELSVNKPLASYFSENSIAKAFWSMISQAHFSDFRTARFSDLHNQIKVIALKNDRVIPANAVKVVFPNVDILDFDFDYTHETPFPTGNISSISAVNEAFDLVFEKAILFFNE